MYLLNHNSRVKKDSIYLNLHSTMYLLNLNACTSTIMGGVTFTFHYVSIKSMYSDPSQAILGLFTFHYVSIKSRKATEIFKNIVQFTFHYVSIKSVKLSSILQLM